MKHARLIHGSAAESGEWHGLDFELAKLIFEGSTLEGLNDRRRLISARKAGKHEQKIHAFRIAALPGAPEEG